MEQPYFYYLHTAKRLYAFIAEQVNEATQEKSDAYAIVLRNEISKILSQLSLCNHYFFDDTAKRAEISQLITDYNDLLTRLGYDDSS